MADMDNLHPPPLLLTLDAAAQALSVSRRTIERMVYGGQLQSITIGSRRLVRTADLARIARNGARFAPAPGPEVQS
jgi:excisionase family DNA binding protein